MEPISQHRHSGQNKEMTRDKWFKKSVAPQQFFKLRGKDKRPKCYNCRKSGHLQVHCWKMENRREER